MPLMLARILPAHFPFIAEVFAFFASAPPIATANFGDHSTITVESRSFFQSRLGQREKPDRLMNIPSTTRAVAPKPSSLSPPKPIPPNPLAYARDCLEQRYVYLAFSLRARGLSIGINLNPDKLCTFNCLYCEIDRSQPTGEHQVDCEVVRLELQQTLELVQSGKILERASCQALPPHLRTLRHVALSGDGEPTICPNFLEIMETVVHVRASGVPFFKIVLITNGSHLHTPSVQSGLPLLTKKDEIWAKLDVGTQGELDRINQSTVSLGQILDNILLTSRNRPVIIQSLFSLVDGLEPTASEILQYALRLKQLHDDGGKIPLVQIYSVTRPPHSNRTRHLPLRTLRQIADTVRTVAGLRVQVF